MKKYQSIAYCSCPANHALSQSLNDGLTSLDFEVRPLQAQAEISSLQVGNVFIFMAQGTWKKSEKKKIHSLIFEQKTCYIAASQINSQQDENLKITMQAFSDDLPVIYPPYDAENLARQLGMVKLVRSNRLLLVDDSPSALAVIKHFVTGLGYQCYATVSAKEALEKIRGGGVDTLLTDYQMDEMSGVQLIEQARKIYPDIKSILITGNSVKATLLDAIRVHVDTFLEKPTNTDVLRSSLARLDHIINMGKENKRLLEELTENNIRMKEGRDILNATLESLNEAVLSLDDNFIIISANSALTRLTQHTVESLIGKAFSCLFPDHVWPVLLQQCSEVQGSISMEGSVIRIDGNVFPANVTFRRSTDTFQRAYILVIQDISPQKRMESHLLSRNEELEIKVAQRTKQIEKAKEEAERANRAKSEFLANMSHELRTPMHAIMSFNALIDKDLEKFQAPITLQEKVKDFTFRISQSSKRLLKLINNLLDISKLESGHVELQRDTVDVLLLINNVGTEFSPLLAEKSLNLNIDCQADKPIAYVDGEKMTQVIYNLLSNACKFSPQNTTIDITLRSTQVNVEARNTNKYWVPSLEVSVCDRGVGIPEGETVSIFDKFIQSSKTKTAAGGTGLGLAICKQIIGVHRGEIIAKNNTHNGACFIFNIPVDPINWSNQTNNLGENRER